MTQADLETRARAGDVRAQVRWAAALDQAGQHYDALDFLARAGVTGLTSHDLRRMAVTRLALSGCTVPEIAAITGHSLRDVEVILVELTESAVLKLESGWAKTKPTSQLTNG